MCKGGNHVCLCRGSEPVWWGDRGVLSGVIQPRITWADTRPDTAGVCFAWLHLGKKRVEGLFVAFWVLISSPGCVPLCSSFPCCLGQLTPKHGPQRPTSGHVPWEYISVGWLWEDAPTFSHHEFSARSEVRLYNLKSLLRKRGVPLEEGPGHGSRGSDGGWLEGTGCRSSPHLRRWPPGTRHGGLGLGGCLQLQTQVGYLASNPVSVAHMPPWEPHRCSFVGEAAVMIY